MTSSKTLEQAIADINIWRKGGERAPHKPLLLLYVLANYQRGHGRMFDYGSEVREQLHSLLERFGPQRTTAPTCLSGVSKAMAFGSCKMMNIARQPAANSHPPGNW